MYIPIWVIAVVLFFINPDLAFLFGIIYCFVINPAWLIPVIAFILLIKAVDYYDYEIAPTIRKYKYKLFRYAVKHRKVHFIIKNITPIIWTIILAPIIIMGVCLSIYTLI
jgi:hypothetical protein